MELVRMIVKWDEVVYTSSQRMWHVEQCRHVKLKHLLVTFIFITVSRRFCAVFTAACSFLR